MGTMDKDSARKFERALQEQFQRRDQRISALEKNLGALHRYVVETQRSAAGHDGAKQFRDHETQYANVILLLGYGGFFALWSSTAGKMPPFLFGLAGILIVISLLLFIGFELAKTTASSTSLTISARKGHDPNESIDRANAAIDKVNLVQPYIFYPAVVTGITAGLIVLWCFSSMTYREAYPVKKTAPIQAAPAPATK